MFKRPLFLKHYEISTVAIEMSSDNTFSTGSHQKLLDFFYGYLYSSISLILEY